MRLTVLGGSAAGPNAGQGCSGYLVEDGRTKLVLDLGPGTLPELRRHTDYRTLDGIVISHLHLDHVLDLLALRFTVAYNPHPIPRPIPLWLPPDGTRVLDKAGEAFSGSEPAERFFSDHFEIAEYDPNAELSVAGTVVTFAPTEHFVPCWAIRVDAAMASGSLVYTADTGPSADLTRFADKSSVLIAEATEPHPAWADPDARGHMTAVEAANLATRARVDHLVLTHLWEEHDVSDALRQAASAFPGPIEVARPALRLTW